MTLKVKHSYENTFLNLVQIENLFNLTKVADFGPVQILFVSFEIDCQFWHGLKSNSVKKIHFQTWSKLQTYLEPD